MTYQWSDKRLWMLAECIVAGKFGMYPVYTILKEVRDGYAAELAKLRADNAELREQLSDVNGQRVDQQTRCAVLRSENDQLRANLRSRLAQAEDSLYQGEEGEEENRRSTT
jgi:septal ring factor EnvC (AmiA/AmiB activator)